MHSLSAICTGKRFVVPANQRGFSWGPTQVEDLIQDMILAHAQTHYMGPLIVSRTQTPDISDDNLENIAEFTLEDGQQRLTTLFIFMKEILRRLDQVDVNGQLLMDRERLRRHIYYRQGEDLPRLTNENAALDQYYRYILEEPGLHPPAERTPPMRALDAVRLKIREFLADKPAEELRRWAARLLERAQLIWIDLSQHNINRYLAFDAINSRGLPLTDFDKIKNFCILIDSERNLGLSADQRWYAAITQLEHFSVSSRSQEDAYISELYSVFHGKIVARDGVHSEFVRRYRSLLTVPDEILANELRLFVSFWERYARSFGFISTRQRNQHYGTMCSDAAGKWLDRLDNMDLLTITRPLLVSTHLRRPPAEFEQIARACEIYIFRMFAVMRFRKDKNASEIIRTANQALRNDAEHTYVQRQICVWLVQSAPMSQVIGRLGDGEPKYAYDSRINGWSKCYYFLYEYEVGNAPTGVGPLPWGTSHAQKINTQEHILPQGHRDGGWWEGHWPDADEAERFKHRLGNLVMTADNNALGRKPIALKLNDPAGGYSFTSHNSTNTERLIGNYTDGQDWRPVHILARERDMLEFAARRWSIPCCADNGIIQLSAEFEVVEGDHTITLSFEDCVEEGEDHNGEGEEPLEDGDGEVEGDSVTDFVDDEA